MTRLAAITLVSLALAGCASSLSAPQTSFESVRALRSADLPAISVGSFTLAPGLPPAMDRSLAIRASSIRPPNGQSFATYLGQNLEEALRTAGRLDSASSIVVSGTLTKNRVSSAVGRGHAELAARFVVTREGRPSFDKEIEVGGEWDSSFIGAAAIPRAEQGYSALYPRLIDALIADPDFQSAVKTN